VEGKFRVPKDRIALRKLSRRNVLTDLGATGIMIAAQSFGGASLLSQSEAAGLLPCVNYVTDIAELRSLTGVQEGQAVAVMTTGRAVLFYFSSGNLSAQVANDFGDHAPAIIHHYANNFTYRE
jgi:hypothetical protein